MGAPRIGRRLSRGIFVVVWALLRGSPVAAGPPPTPRPEDRSILNAGAAIERRLTGDDVHAFHAHLDAGAWRFLVTQHGVDTVTEVVLPDGVRRGPFDSPAGRWGTEALVVTLDVAGIVEVVIRPRSESAAGRYTVALERLGDAAVPAESAAAAAGLAYAAGDKEAAGERYREALSLWPPADAAGRARILGALANLVRSLGEPREAVELYRQALPLWRSLGDREGEATTLNRLGLTLDRLGESGAALQLFTQALALWQALGDRPAAALQKNNLCLALQRQGELAEARGCYEATRLLFRELDDPLRETLVLSNLAGVYWKLGEPERALASFDAVLAECRVLEEPAMEGRTLSNRALLSVELGEAEDALLDFGRALAVFRRLDDRRMEGAVLSHLGSTYLDLGEHDRARTLLEQSLPLLRETGDLRGVGSTLRSLGRAYGALDERKRALDAYGEALELARELDDRRGEAMALRLVGEAHADAGSLPRAASELAQAAELYRRMGNRGEEGQALLALGKAHHRMGESAQALVFLDRALGIVRRVRHRLAEIRALEARVRVLRDRGETERALAEVGAAVELTEDLRVRTGALRQRSAFFAARRGVYELQVDLLMTRHRSEPAADYDGQAFAASERARSRALLDVVEAHAGSALDDDLRRRLTAATRRLAARTERQMEILSGPSDDAEAATADRAVVAALGELESLRAEARRRPAYAALAAPEVLDAGRTAALLEAGTLLLELALGEERSYLWAVSSASLAAFELPGRQRVEALARRAHGDLSTLDLRTGTTARQALGELGEVLLAPVADRLAAARRVVVVADGALHYVPFAALPQPGGGEPLVAAHEVTHLPSASTLAAQRRRSSPPATKTVAIFADPVFVASDPRLTVRAEPAAEVPALVRGDLANLGRLSASGREAAAIAALAPAADSLMALGFDANRERVVGGELAPYRYIHFATHGLIHSRRPELSGIVLSRFAADGRRRNGFLSMDDIYGLELAAELAVLSGCRTALGREVRGEGLLGLTRGFLAAGVPRVVASLWPVRDEATAELMARFYRGLLADGLSPAAALAAAQRSIRAERRWADPYFWAPFVLLGDWR